MRHPIRLAALSLLIVLGYAVLDDQPAHGQSRAQTVAPVAAADVRAWDNTLNAMLRTGEMRVRVQRNDTLIPGRVLEQIDQYVNGVRVWGGSVSRQLNGDAAVSIFGAFYDGLTIDATPTLTQQDAQSRIEAIGNTTLGPSKLPQLVILPGDDGSFRLVWVGEIVGLTTRLRLFIDATDGSVVRQDDLREGQAAGSVGQGTGVLGDTKKLSTESFAGGFVAIDQLRPPSISTFNLRSNLAHAVGFLNGVNALTSSDYASTTSSDIWNDPATVDAHVYSGFTYDYYFKRFGRLGLDNANKQVLNLVHLVRREDVFSAPAAQVGLYWVNAFYAGDGVMVYGEGLPPDIVVTSTGHHYNYFSGAIDIVAHELTHGVTQYTSNLEYRNESGALNEAFSDIMGTSVEFFVQPPGNGSMKADYLLGEDISTTTVPGGTNGDRSMENPGLFGDPDHYSRRYIGTNDNGGVHTNSGIVNQAFYLAVEGGTNRTSGIKVQGVGGAKRDQMEKVFYRAFAQLMPSNANFAMARVITLQAAQDLYGVNSPPYNAVRDAWTAVGVN